MPNYFTHAQAEQMVTRVRALIEQLRELNGDRMAAESELNSICRNIVLSGGMIPPRQRMAEIKVNHEQLLDQANAVLGQIHAFGCEVKDLDKGLVDFPTLYRGQVVYLCWRLGEDRISYWHTPQDGFRGRRLIDEDFLVHHRGEASH